MVCILFLAFTGLHMFKIGNISFSYYVIFSTLFIGLISILIYKIPPIKNPLILLILLYIILSALINFNAFKFTSVMYSIMFLTFFIYIIYYSKENLKINNFVWLLKFIIIAFFVIMIVSQIMVFFDLHTLERPIGYFQSTGELGIQFNHRTQSYRYYSLSTEPSYSAIIVMLSFIILRDLTEKKKKLLPYIFMVFYMFLFFKSAMGFIIAFFYILTQVKITKKQFLIFGFLVLIAVSMFFFTDLGGKSVNRIREILALLFTDFSNFIENLRNIDSSAHARIGPTFRYFEQMDLLSYHTYFGYGAATSEPFFSKIIYPEAWNTHMIFRPPFIPGFLYDYGLVGAFLVCFFIWRLLKNTTLIFKIIVLFVLINSNFNTQLFWFAIVIIELYKFFKKDDLIESTEFEFNYSISKKVK